MKIFRPLLAISAGLAVAQAGPGITGLGLVRHALFPALSGSGLPDHVALTFDDGPDQETTSLFLDLLARCGVRATFFLLGSRVAMMPRIAALIADAGHEVGVHGWEHRYLILRGPLAVYDDLARTAEVIARATGKAPSLFRPPYGVLSGPSILAAGRLGLTPVLWSCWGREWTPGATPYTVFTTTLAGLKGGATVLLHDSDCTSPAGSAIAALGALPMLLDEIGRRNLRVGPLGEHGLAAPAGVPLPAWRR
ncbi:MAG TPA: polysaccharide deacetylase family protein [Streptosporangiaceae bacterium]|nr:polysaccharide deacetylase family protein [Streptosporangiaceae bacterium]